MTHKGTLSPNRNSKRFGDAGHKVAKGVWVKRIADDGQVVVSESARDELIITDMHCHVVDPLDVRVEEGVQCGHSGLDGVAVAVDQGRHRNFVVERRCEGLETLPLSVKERRRVPDVDLRVRVCVCESEKS